MRRSLFLAFILLCGSVLMVYSGQGIHTTEQIDDAVDIAQDVGSVTGIVESDGLGNISVATEGTDYYGPGGTDVAVADGGTGSSTASAARTALGLAIGTDVLAPDGDGSSLTALTASQITDQHASTDITADLEEETHATEHGVSAADTIFPTDPNDDLCLQWDDDPGELVWAACGSGAGITDLDDLPGDTVDDDLIDWAIVDTAVVDATTGDSATEFFDAGTIEHEYGGLEDDVSAYAGLVSITGGATAQVDEIAELNALISDATLEDDTHASEHAVGAADAVFPADPDADRYLKWNDGGGAIEWATGSGISEVLDDTTPQLGGDLDLNSKNIDFPTTANISDVIDDDTMATASATTLATSESITAYVDTELADHDAIHAVSGSDTVFPADPNSDLFLMWDDVPGELVWSASSVADSTITAAKMADADHGHVSWTSTVATVEDFNLNANATVGDDIRISFGNGTDANFEWDTAATPDQFMLDMDNAAIDSEYLITNSDGTYEANLTVEGDIESASGVFIGDGSSLTGVQLTDADVTSIAGGVTGLVKGLGDGSGYEAGVAGTDYVAPDADLTVYAAGITGLMMGQGNGSGAAALANADNVKIATTTSGHEFTIQVYDNDGTAWVDCLTFTNGNSPAVTLGSGCTLSGVGAISTSSAISTTGVIKGRASMGADISASTSHDTDETHGVLYHFTAAATVTLDAAADAGYGAQAGYKIRDAAEAAVIDVQAGEKINLNGTALAAGTAITATGVGEYCILVATTDTDGSGTDGWETWGCTSGWASE